MATAFNTQTGNGEYRLQFETDNMDHFLLMQATARQCIDGKPQTHADQIRAMSDEELAKLIYSVDGIGWCKSLPECVKQVGLIPEEKCIGCALEWLRQPAEVSGDA